MNNILFKTIMLKGDKGDPGADGAEIVSIEKTASVGLIDTWTITLSTGETQTFEIKNGENAQLYEIPQGSIIAYDSTPETITETSDNSNILQIENANGINKIKISGITKQNALTGKNLFAGVSWVNGYFRNDGVYIAKTTGLNDCACVDFSKIDPNDSAVFSWGGWSVKIPGDFYVFSYSAANEQNFLGKTTLQLRTGDTSIVFSNPYNADYIRVYFHGAGAYDQYIPVNFQCEKGTTPTDYEQYCGGVPSPSPDYPQAINGIGELQQDETYTINLTVEDTENNTTYNLTAAGLTAPVYAGDVIDILNGTITRVNGYKILDGSESWSKYNNENYPNSYFFTLDDMMDGARQNGKSDRFIVSNNSDHIQNSIWLGVIGYKRVYVIETTALGVTDVASWKTWLENNETNIVYPLATPTEETVTITGDVTEIKNIIGEQITITAPADVTTLQAEFLQDTGTPDGYETFDAHWDTEITPASNWAPETRAVYDELYFKNGDEIITGDNVDNPAPLLSGYCTTNYYRVVMQLPKRLTENQTVTVERLSGMTIYTSAGSSYVAVGSYDIGVRIVRELNQLIITFTPATSDPDRGGFCAITGQFKITITEEA